MPVAIRNTIKSAAYAAARRFARRIDGIAAVEFALIVPIMLCMFIGTVELSQAITVDRRVTQVASTTADLVARQKTITASTLNGYMQIVDQLMSPYSATDLKMTITNVYNTTAAPTSYKVCWSYPRTGKPANLNTLTTGSTFVSASGGTLPTGVLDAAGGTSVVVVEVSYLYQPVLLFSATPTSIGGAQISSYIGSAGISMTETFYLKPRLSASIQYESQAVCI